MANGLPFVWAVVDNWNGEDFYSIDNIICVAPCITPNSEVYFHIVDFDIIENEVILSIPACVCAGGIVGCLYTDNNSIDDINGVFEIHLTGSNLIPQGDADIMYHTNSSYVRNSQADITLNTGTIYTATSNIKAGTPIYNNTGTITNNIITSINQDGSFDIGES